MLPIAWNLPHRVFRKIDHPQAGFDDGSGARSRNAAIIRFAYAKVGTLSCRVANLTMLTGADIYLTEKILQERADPSSLLWYGERAEFRGKAVVADVEAIDIWQTAKILIGRYGARARLEAAWLASVGYQSGIPNSVHVWKRVAEAIEQLQRAQQPGEARSGQRRSDDS